MDWYTIFKFLHVVSAIAWVGGGVVLMAIAIFANRDKNESLQMQVVDHTTYLATRWFIPSSLATVVFGIVVATIGGLWGQAWVVLGLLGFAATFATGMLYFKPTSELISKLNAEGKAAEARAKGGEMLTVSKFDYVVLFVVVADMVFKPGWGDLIFLALMAVVLVVAGYFFLRPIVGRPAAT
jgi:uncharacterized membrane protein